MTAAATDDVIDRWTAAERAGDHVTLQELIAEDFLFVGPLGFVLDKEQWVERHRADQLHHTRFAIEDTRTRTYGDVTVLVGVQDQQRRLPGPPDRRTLPAHADPGRRRRRPANRGRTPQPDRAAARSVSMTRPRPDAGAYCPLAVARRTNPMNARAAGGRWRLGTGLTLARAARGHAP